MADTAQTHAEHVRTREMGATATLGRSGYPHIRSATGGELDIVTGVHQAGFNPLDLLYASLSACLVMSARIAASRLGVLQALEEVSAVVTGEKATDEPSRVARFDIRFTIKGDFDDATRHEIARLAEEEICTVSNTISSNPQFHMMLAE